MMAIQPIGPGPIIVNPVNQNPIPNVNGTPVTVNNTAVIDSGPAAGEVFSGRANSFLDPNDILATINNFGKSIGKNNGILENNPNSSEIMSETQKAINEIFSRNFIPETITLPLMNLPLALPLPDVTNNPLPSQINLASLFMRNLILSLNVPPAQNPNGQNPIPPGNGNNGVGGVVGGNGGATANTSMANLIQQSTAQFINAILQNTGQIPAQNQAVNNPGDITNDISRSPFAPGTSNQAGALQTAFANPGGIFGANATQVPNLPTQGNLIQNPVPSINSLIPQTQLLSPTPTMTQANNSPFPTPQSLQTTPITPGTSVNANRQLMDAFLGLNQQPTTGLSNNPVTETSMLTANNNIGFNSLDSILGNARTTANNILTMSSNARGTGLTFQQQLSQLTNNLNTLIIPETR